MRATYASRRIYPRAAAAAGFDFHSLKKDVQMFSVRCLRCKKNVRAYVPTDDRTLPIVSSPRRVIEQKLLWPTVAYVRYVYRACRRWPAPIYPRFRRVFARNFFPYSAGEDGGEGQGQEGVVVLERAGARRRSGFQHHSHRPISVSRAGDDDLMGRSCSGRKEGVVLKIPEPSKSRVLKIPVSPNWRPCAVFASTSSKLEVEANCLDRADGRLDRADGPTLYVRRSGIRRQTRTDCPDERGNGRTYLSRIRYSRVFARPSFVRHLPTYFSRISIYITRDT